MWIALIALVAAGVGFAGWRYVEGDLPFLSRPATNPSPPHVPTPAEITAARPVVEAKLHSVPEYAGFFARLQDKFPADYAQIVDDFAARAAGGDTPNADRYLSEAYRALRQTRGIMAAKAGPDALGRVFDTRAAVLKALGSADPHLCVDFLYGGATQAYFDFSASHRTLVADMAQASLDAVIDGHLKNVERERPSDADFDQLERALSEKGLSKAEIGALIDGKIPDPPIDDARLCSAGQVNLEALKSLPDDPRQRIYGLTIELMARS